MGPGDPSIAGMNLGVYQSGKITALWDYSPGGTRVLKLYANGATVATATVVSSGGQWVQAPINPPISVNNNTSYLVTTYGASHYVTSYIYRIGIKVSWPASIQDWACIYEGSWWGSGAGFCNTVLAGIIDVTFIPD